MMHRVWTSTFRRSLLMVAHVFRNLNLKSTAQCWCTKSLHQISVDMVNIMNFPTNFWCSVCRHLFCWSTPGMNPPVPSGQLGATSHLWRMCGRFIGPFGASRPNRHGSATDYGLGCTLGTMDPDPMRSVAWLVMLVGFFFLDTPVQRNQCHWNWSWLQGGLFHYQKET